MIKNKCVYIELKNIFILNSATEHLLSHRNMKAYSIQDCNISESVLITFPISTWISRNLKSIL